MGKNYTGKPEKQKEAMVVALQACSGNIQRAAKIAKISPQTHYRWCKEDTNYYNLAGSMRDICYRTIKEDLIDAALEKVKKGDSTILSKMLSLFFKNFDEELKTLNKFNNVPLRATYKYVDTREEAAAIMAAQAEERRRRENDDVGGLVRQVACDVPTKLRFVGW